MHMKRLTAPKTWQIKRKEDKFITRPSPGGHPFSHSIPLIVLLRDIMKLFKDGKEAKMAIVNMEIEVDGVVRRNPKFGVGIMDIVSIPKMKKSFRISLDDKGRLTSVEIKDSDKKLKVCRIKTKKHVTGGKLQFGLHDGRTILAKKKTDNKYKVNDSLLIQLPEQKVLKHLPVDKNMSAIIISGKHAGEVVVIQETKTENIVVKDDEGEVFETLLKYAIILGKKKPELKVR